MIILLLIFNLIKFILIIVTIELFDLCTFFSTPNWIISIILKQLTGSRCTWNGSQLTQTTLIKTTTQKKQFFKFFVLFSKKRKVVRRPENFSRRKEVIKDNGNLFDSTSSHAPPTSEITIKWNTKESETERVISSIFFFFFFFLFFLFRFLRFSLDLRETGRWLLIHLLGPDGLSGCNFQSIPRFWFDLISWFLDF